jgi:Tol biopolymer transport system component
MNKRRWMIWVALAALGLLFIGLVIAGNGGDALIVGTFPEDGDAVGPDSRVGIEFTQPMQAVTVTPLFQIEPTTPGKLTWEGQRLWFAPDKPFQPGVCYIARLKAGAVSQQGQRMAEGLTWHFRARTPWVLYLSFANGHRRLWRMPSTGGEAEPLTPSDQNVYDFASAPTGEQIVYSVANDKRGVDLWLMTRGGKDQRVLVDCGADQCEAPAWSPEGRLIAYSRYPAGIYAEEAPHPDRVWMVDLNTDQTTPLYQDPQILGQNPSWSPDGRWLAFFDASIGSMRVLNLQTRKEVTLRTSLLAVGAWSPDGSRMLINDLKLESPSTHALVYMADLTKQTRTVVLGNESDGTVYGIPAWSPTGDWVVVRLQRSSSGPASQLWLMRPDGQEGRFITNDPTYSYNGYSWDVCGQTLLLQRVEVNKQGAKPETVIWTMATGEMRVLIQDISIPVWLP